MKKAMFKKTLTIFIFLLIIYPVIEVGLVRAANPETIVLSQYVSSEISLVVTNTDLTLSPAISGLVGGTGNADTSVNIITNNKEGYTVTVQATTTAGRLATMNGDSTAGYISDYSSTTPVTWADTLAGEESQFGFGITNTSLSSANGASGYGTCAGVEACWSKLATTTQTTVVSVTTFTQTAGDNFSLKFRVHIPANANPLVPQDWYTATTTVTATVI